MGNVCQECGADNPPGTEFCLSCHAFLAWGDSEAARRTQLGPPPSPTSAPEATETRQMPRVVPSGGPGVQEPSPGPPPEQRFRVLSEPAEVTVPPSGEPASLAVRLTNVSTIVDGYAVDLPGGPPWLAVQAAPLELMPRTEGDLAVQVRITSPTLVPAQQLPLRLRVRSLSQPAAEFGLRLLITVPVVDAPIRLRAEPQLLRLRDRDTAAGLLLVDNSASNRPVQLRFSGSDPELAARFRFDPAVLDLGPGGNGSVQIQVSAPLPEPGTEISRPLTITAHDGTRTADTLLTLQQAASARVEDPPVGLEVEPSLVRVRDTTAGGFRVVADNRAGSQWAHLQLRAADPERVVRVSWASPQLHVPPGGTAYAEGRLDAPLPAPGSESSRTVTVTASDGRRTSTATLSFVQQASASPMSTLAVRIEPSVVRVRDADSAGVQVVLDNRQGRAAVRLFLGGTDPERAIGFAFGAPAVDLRAGEVRSVGVRLDAWRPPPGQELTRPFTITAGDGRTSVSGSGTLVQTSSRAAIESLTLRLDPSVLRLARRRRGSLTAVIDNRHGAQPVQVSLSGDDPENVVRFSFVPAALTVPAGQVATSTVTVRAPGAPAGRELTRPITVSASDGRVDVVATGSISQFATSRRPVVGVLLTLLGALLMMIGATMPWTSDTDGTDFLEPDQVAGFFRQTSVLPDQIEGFLSAGAVVILWAIVMLFGLTGRTGRLIRLAAVLVALGMLGLLVVTLVIGVLPALVGSGVLVVLTGCVLGFIGGLLVRR